MQIKYSRNDLREIVKESKDVEFKAGFRLIVYGNTNTSHLWCVKRYGEQTGYGVYDPEAQVVTTLAHHMSVKELKDEIERIYKGNQITIRWKA